MCLLYMYKCLRTIVTCFTSCVISRNGVVLNHFIMEDHLPHLQ